MIRQIIKGLLIACVVVGIYKAFGGDVGSFVAGAGSIILNIVDAGSDVVLQIWNAIVN